MQYLDTSLLVSAYTTEPATGRVQMWLGEQRGGELAISDWVITEFSAALSMKLRMGQLDPDTRAHALTLFARFCAESVTILPVSPLHFRIAARLIDQHELGLRAPDALHLAICTDHGATLYTRDRRLADVGPALGLMTTLL